MTEKQQIVKDYNEALIKIKPLLEPSAMIPGKAGCTDPLATNFDPEATTSTDTCLYKAED